MRPYFRSFFANRLQSNSLNNLNSYAVLNRRDRCSGFTLLELLVVLGLLALMTGLVMPRMVTIYESFRWANERDDALRRIGTLGYQAYKNGKGFSLASYPADSTENIPLELPQGWQLKATPPISYRENGICGGGRLRLSYKDQSLDLLLSPPLCRPEIL